jgi:hypothetical protein
VRGADRQAAELCHIGHALMENRNGLVVDTSLTKPPAPPNAKPQLR